MPYARLCIALRTFMLSAMKFLRMKIVSKDNGLEIPLQFCKNLDWIVDVSAYPHHMKHMKLNKRTKSENLLKSSPRTFE